MDKLCFPGALILILIGCHSHPQNEAHGPNDHDAAHASGAEHSHDGPEDIQITVFNDLVELFIEHPPFLANENGLMAAHVTHVQDWSPRTEGPVTFILKKEGQPSIEIVESEPVEPGIYVPFVNFPASGDWTIEIQVPMDQGLSISTIEAVKVYDNIGEAPQHGSSKGDNEISFLKEQQWRMPFASAPAVTKDFREAITANGKIEPQANGHAIVSAPVSGKLAQGSKPAPYVGQLVEKGRLLGSIIPRLEQFQDPASLTSALEKAELKHQHAQKEYQRLSELYKVEAISKMRVRQAALEMETAAAELRAAKSRSSQASLLQTDKSRANENGVHLYSPLTGTVIDGQFVPGSHVEEGDSLFHIANLETLWLSIDVPESEMGKIKETPGAWFRVNGIEQVFEATTETGSRLVALGGQVNSQKRTVPLIFEIPNPKNLMKLGMFVQASVLTGQVSSGVSIPVAALTEEDGQTTVYVQTGGESFERRTLKTGIRDGDRIQVISGVESGERVVVQGAYQIRLSATSDAVPAHGHSH